MELIVALAGAQILVNTVGLVKGTMQQDSQHYGWVMSGFGIGATIAAFGIGLLNRWFNWPVIAAGGALMASLAILPTYTVSLTGLIVLWALAGVGQSLAEMPNQFLIAERTPPAEQGRVYGAHFAWSHTWWAIGYPVAGWLGSRYTPQAFWLGGLIAVGCWLVAKTALRRSN